MARVARSLVSSFPSVLLLLPGNATAQGVGSWSNTWEWQNELFEHGENPALPDPCDQDCPNEPEISHASLIPRGPYRGCVLIMRRQVGAISDITGNFACNVSDATTKTWIFNPASPSQLIVINTGITESDIFCSGHGWDSMGHLVAAGGVPAGTNEANPGTFPAETYRFYPEALGSALAYDTCTNPWTPYASQSYLGAWRKLSGLMAIERYYPTFMPLLKRTAFFASGMSIPGPAGFVLGGPPRVQANEGNEFWEILKVSANAWEKHFLPDGAGPTTPYTPHYVSPKHDGFETFQRVVSGSPPRVPENLFDSYPRSVQTSATTNAILIASDVDTGSPGVNTPGSTWVIKPRYSLSPQTNWELHNGLTGPAYPGYTLWHDGFYDTVVVIQELSGSSHMDRILMFGGSRFDNVNPNVPAQGQGWIVNEEVWEFQPVGTIDPIVQGNWVRKRDRDDGLEFKRLFCNAVVLPTKEIFIVGGSSVDECGGHGAGGSAPVLAPILFELGADAPSPGTVSTQPAPPSLVERLYHSVAVLLPDGRVFIAGGRQARDASCTTVNSASSKDARYSGEIFSPPYLDEANTGISQPVLSSEASVIDLGMSFTVEVTREEGVPVDAMVAIRPGSVTHHFDNDQRYTELQFTVTQTTLPDPNGLVTDTINVFAPGETVLAPAFYMLFAVIDDNSGTAGHRVPSAAEFVRFN